MATIGPDPYIGGLQNALNNQMNQYQAAARLQNPRQFQRLWLEATSTTSTSSTPNFWIDDPEAQEAEDIRLLNIKCMEAMKVRYPNNA